MDHTNPFEECTFLQGRGKAAPLHFGKYLPGFDITGQTTHRANGRCKECLSLQSQYLSFPQRPSLTIQVDHLFNFILLPSTFNRTSVLILPTITSSTLLFVVDLF